MVLTVPVWTAFARRCARWLVWAMLLATLAPAVSRTLVSIRDEGSGGWVELCTSSGLQRVALPDAPDNGGDPSGDTTAHRVLDHCGHCLLAAERFAPLLAAWALLPFEPETRLPPAASAASPPPPHPATRPSARGPPFLI